MLAVAAHTERHRHCCVGRAQPKAALLRSTRYCLKHHVAKSMLSKGCLTVLFLATVKAPVVICEFIRGL